MDVIIEPKSMKEKQTQSALIMLQMCQPMIQNELCISL